MFSTNIFMSGLRNNIIEINVNIRIYSFSYEFV